MRRAFLHSGDEPKTVAHHLSYLIVAHPHATGAIGLTAGNLVQLGGINQYNAGVKLKLIWKRRNKKIKKAEMFLEDTLLTFYDEWYRNQNYNNANTNTDGVQQYLIGTEKKCKLVSCYGMDGMGYIFLTDGKKNMRIGIDGIGTGENATGDFIVRTGNNPKTVQLFTDCWIGVNFTSVDQRFLMTATYNINDESVYATVSAEEIDTTGTHGTAKTATVDFQGYNLTSATTVTVRLTQEQTLAWDYRSILKVQLNWLLPNGVRVASSVWEGVINEQLLTEVMS